MNVAKTFASNMKRFRGARDLTQAGLAELLGVSEQSVWYYENGTHWPRPDMVAAIAKALKIRPWQLLAEEGEGGAIPPDVVDLASQLARACGIKVGR